MPGLPAVGLSDDPPLFAVTDLGAGALRSQHPTYDGRGITIGHVEASLRLVVPEFETAYTLDGKPTQKMSLPAPPRSGALPRGGFAT